MTFSFTYLYFLFFSRTDLSRLGTRLHPRLQTQHRKLIQPRGLGDDADVAPAADAEHREARLVESQLVDGEHGTRDEFESNLAMAARALESKLAVVLQLLDGTALSEWAHPAKTS